jgi:hypothetical protein
MSVLVEALNVIVPVAVLNAKYKGDAVAYGRDCPNRTFCTDGYLTRVGFMTPCDVQSCVEGLERSGFVHRRGGDAAEMGVVDEYRGPTCPCPWIQGGRHRDGYSAVWLTGGVPGPFAHPPGWKVGHLSNLVFTPTEETKDRFFTLALEDNVETVLDLKTGKQQYIGRVAASKPSFPPGPEE